MSFLVPKMERMQVHSSKPSYANSLPVTDITVNEANKTPQVTEIEDSQIIKIPAELREQFNQFYDYRPPEISGDIHQQFGARLKERLQESAEDDNFN